MVTFDSGRLVSTAPVASRTSPRGPGVSGRRMFQRALDHGIDSVDEPPDSLVRLFAQLDHRPPWVDDDQLRRGSIAYFREGV